MNRTVQTILQIVSACLSLAVVVLAVFVAASNVFGPDAIKKLALAFAVTTAVNSALPSVMARFVAPVAPSLLADTVKDVKVVGT